MGQTIQTDQLEGGNIAPGNYKYYGTNGVGAKAFQDLNTSILALGYTPSGGGGPIDGLDGIITGSNTASAAGAINYRANYRGDSTGTWTDSANGVWYKDNFVYTTIAGTIRKHNLNGDIVASLVAASSGGIIFSHPDKDFLFTRNNSQKVIMSTMANGGAKGFLFGGFSPSGNIGVAVDDTAFTSGTINFDFFDTGTMTTLYTHSITYNTYPSNNSFGGITFLDETTVVFIVVRGLNGARDVRFIKYNFVTNTVVVNSQPPSALGSPDTTYSPPDDKSCLIYNPTNGVLYYLMNENYSGSTTRPRIWTINQTTLVGTVFLTTLENVRYPFMSNDGSLCVRYVFGSYETKFLVKNNNKFWNGMVTGGISGNPVSQLTVVQ